MRNDVLLEVWHHSVRKALIKRANDISKNTCSQEQREREKNGSEAPSEDSRKLVSKEGRDAAEAGRIAAVNSAMRSGNQVIQVVYESLILDFFPGNRQVGSRSPVKPSEFPNFLAGEPPQPQPGSSCNQFLEARPFLSPC